LDAVAAGAEPIGPERVDHHKNDIARRVRRVRLGTPDVETRYAVEQKHKEHGA
jgi:hypothetical protein